MKYFKFLVLTFLSFFLFLILPQDSFAATYYVAGDTGLDTNNGSITTPWKTIQKAADTMIAGDTVNVKGSLTYNETVNPSNSGTLSDRITYRSWPGTGIPIIASSDFGFISYRDYITIDGFKIKNPLIAGIWINAGGGSGNYNILKNNTIELLSGGVGIHVGSMVRQVNIFNNKIIGAQSLDTGIDITLITIDGFFTCVTPEIIVSNNIVHNTNIGINRLLSIGNGNNCINLANNVFNSTTNYNNIVAGSHDITSDPLFVAPSLSNFHLQRTSPAINSGTDLTASGVTTDILGVPRPQGSGFDIGAYEYYDIPVTVTGSYPNFTGTSSTINTGTISSIQYSVDGGTWQTSGVTGTTTFSIVIPQELYIPDGNHTLIVKATDSYTNETDSSIYATTTFNKDTVVKTTSVNNTCTAVKPEGTPVITSITNLTPTSVKLMFSDSWTNTVDSYFVEYGTKPNVYQYSTQSIGGKGTKETTISNLTPNKTYYFRIRNGNNCNVGNWSTPVSIKNEKLTINNLKTPTPEIKTNTKEVVTPKSTTTPVQVPTNQKTNTNIFTIIISWLTNAFKKLL